MSSPATVVIQGILLSASQRDTELGIEFSYWIKTTSGAQQLVVGPERGVFFVLAEDGQKIDALLADLGGWQRKSLSLKDLNQKPVDGLYCQTLELQREVISRLHRGHIGMMEEDIRPADRYLMERYINAGIYAVKQGDNWRLKPSNERPELSLLSLDIETSMSADELFSIGLYASDGLHRVLMRGEGKNEGYISYFSSERALLRALNWIIEEWDPDILVGWNVVGFDLAVLQRRADALKQPLLLGRDKQPLSLHQSESGKLFCRLPGRLVLDGIDVLKNASYHFESYSLENVSRELLGRGKLVEKVEQRGGEILQMFHFDKPALARYNLEDCKLVLDIFAKAKLLAYLCERAQLTGLRLDKIGGWARAFDNCYLPDLHRQGYVAPQYASGVDDMASPGGYVMNSRPGLYRNVLVLDFKSLYPSIIRTFKIDPMGLAEGLDKQGELPWVAGYNGAIFSRDKHILPGVIDKLWQARDAAKAESNGPLSQAIKIIMSSMYGVLGSKNCRFFDHRLSGSITLRGHQILTTTAEQIEQQFGYQVIYGDTDSVFVWLGEDSDEQAADAIGKHLMTELNRWWQKKISQLHGVPSLLEIEYETHYSRFLMPTMRASEQGSKKRYVGLKRAPNGETGLVFKGMENVRSDWTPLARQLQHDLFAALFSDSPYIDLLKQTIDDLREGRIDEQLVYRKRLRQPLSNYVKNRPPHAQAAQKLAHELKAQGLPLDAVKPGQPIAYCITVNGPEPVDYRRSTLDYEHYIERQIRPVAEVLPLDGHSFDELAGLQMGLF